ncbi:hypothetical protein RHMOL_Rhmol09G0092600 [Rhododendron molle]|uniref:Uncharacterized protein n=1 Tax=Rhododendron molle TaxID=49168 RepID=A0ACC0MBG8_RHOML|nr:hypothetical protein RHMOL_Rhmol09G0092600 [Rhododendron molle]
MNLENDMHILFETNEFLESKVAKLQVELDKANATFKKLNVGSQILDEVLSSQKVALDRVANKAKSSVKEKNVKYAHTKLPKVKKQCPTVKIATTKHGEHVPKIVEKFEKVKTRPIWVRKLDLRTHIDLLSNPLDDYRSSNKVDLTL